MRVNFSVFAAAALAFASLPTYSQTAPDAGTLLREQLNTAVPAQRAPTIPMEVQAAPSAPEADDAPTVLVNRLIFAGNNLVSSEQLQALSADMLGRELTFTQMHDLTLRLAVHYANLGYLARVVILPQDIIDGVVTLTVIEGVRGQVRIETSGERLSETTIQRMLDDQLVAGSALDTARLGEAVNLLNELPGLSVSTLLTPGQNEGEIDLVVTATERPLISGFAVLNNFGSRSSGVPQATLSLSLDNPSGRFDALSVLGNISEGTRFGRVQYSAPLGISGLRLGAYASQLRYEVVQQSLNALEPSGTATSMGVTGSLPLVSRNGERLALQISLERRNLRDKTTAGETRDRQVDTASLGATGFQLVGLDDSLTYGLTLSVGNSDEGNALAAAADELFRREVGDYFKLALELGYTKYLSSTLSAALDFQGQVTNTNLDSVERISLGGPSGVRGFPVAEASGDQGMITSFSLSRAVRTDLTLTGFADFGRIQVNKRAPAGTAINYYNLSSLGLNLAWRPTPRSVVDLSVAEPISGNRGETVAGREGDGSERGARIWATYFTRF